MPAAAIDCSVAGAMSAGLQVPPQVIDLPTLDAAACCKQASPCCCNLPDILSPSAPAMRSSDRIWAHTISIKHSTWVLQLLAGPPSAGACACLPATCCLNICAHQHQHHAFVVLESSNCAGAERAQGAVQAECSDSVLAENWDVTLKTDTQARCWSASGAASCWQAGAAACLAAGRLGWGSLMLTGLNGAA